VKGATRAVLILLVVWLAAWTVRMAFDGRSGETASIHIAEGYVQAVDLFLRHEWLTYDAAQQRIVRDVDEASPMEEFYRSSHLQRDVEAFNEGERSIFRIENGQILSIDPTRHNIVLPFSEVRSWQGLLTYRPEVGGHGELIGDRIQVDLNGPTLSLRDQDDIPAVVVPRPNGKLGPQRQHGEAVSLVGEGNIFFGKTHLIGRSILFNHRGLDAGASIEVSGEQVPTGNHFRLDSGDLLKLRWRLGSRGTQYSLLWGLVQGEAPVISAWRGVNGHWRRTPEKPDPPFTRHVVEALDQSFRRQQGGRYVIPERRRADEFDLALTLDSELQNAVQEKLLEYVRPLRGTGGVPFRAAVTVMDAKTGELLALASYPTEADLRKWKESNDARERLLRNHNFARLPIGSMAKVMFSAAILDDSPFLASLRIPAYPGGDIEQILGIELNPILEDHGINAGPDGWIDFDEFIEHSSNKYAATLLTLATGVKDSALLPPMTKPGVPDLLDPQERFELGGQIWERRPNLQRLAVGANLHPRDPEGPRLPRRDLAACGRIVTLEHAQYAPRLLDLFDVEISRKTVRSVPDRLPRRGHGPGEGDDLVDTSMWLPLLEQLYEDKENIPVNHSFYAASPERENLAYNLITDYRTQYLSVILGGGSSTWTMPRVAEVFSRLVTGRRVNRTLIRRVGLWDGDTIEPYRDSQPPALEMKPEIRKLLLDAMTRVASPQGTASRLNPTLRALDRSLAERGKVLGFFSKTGSPDIPMFVPSRAGRAVDALIRNGALRLDAEGRIVYRDNGPVNSDPPEADAPPVKATLDALKAHAGDMAVLRRYGVGPGLVVRVADAWNDARREDRNQFETKNGRLVRMQTLNVNQIDLVGGAYAFTMAIYPGAARQDSPGPGYLPRIDVLHHQPERALTVSIVIEGQGNGPTVAVPFAKILIDKVLQDALEKGW
jgi:hypothetical protein